MPGPAGRREPKRDGGTLRPAGLLRAARRGGLILALAAVGTVGTRAETLTGDRGYEPIAARNLAAGTVIDARAATFRVANSQNQRPVEGAACDTGPLPVNRYPLRILESPGVTLLGGRFDGEVPLDTDWVHTYCNSTTIGFVNSPDARVEGTRIRRAWDGIRFSGKTPSFGLRWLWLSDIRDDCIENDFLHTGEISDVLFDGCFNGVSVYPAPDREEDGSARTVTLNRVLIRLQPYFYKGALKNGAPFKANAKSPAIRIYDSVIALEGADFVSRTQNQTGWEKITDCDNNVLLWLPDEPFPAKRIAPPACFHIIQGEEARMFWTDMRQNWIDCHPAFVRFDGDPLSNADACRPIAGGE